jgi:hypothetical protein
VAYNLPRGRAVVDRGKVAEAAQKTAQAEAPHAALPAQPGQAAACDKRPSQRISVAGVALVQQLEPLKTLNSNAPKLVIA